MKQCFHVKCRWEELCLSETSVKDTRVIFSVHQFSILIFHFILLISSFIYCNEKTNNRKKEKEKKDQRTRTSKMKSAICGRILSPNPVFKPGSSSFFWFRFLGTSTLWFYVYCFPSFFSKYFECSRVSVAQGNWDLVIIMWDFHFLERNFFVCWIFSLMWMW